MRLCRSLVPLEIRLAREDLLASTHLTWPSARVGLLLGAPAGGRGNLLLAVLALLGLVAHIGP